MTTPAITYRPDIDGLRAVAVMAVVLHHLAPSAFPGGYVGVDVFFVISGYLITRIIRRELSEGTFTFAGFYERRIRRIFPALFAVLAAVLVVGYFVLLPTDYLTAFRGALGTSLFSANILFWRDLLDGYFAADAKLNPLLHMWSLGVEEQFYLFFPFLLLLCAKYLERWLLPLLVLAAAVSLACAQYLIADKPVAVFFLLPFRAWELLVGAILALAAFPALGGRWRRDALSIVGLAAIVLPTFVYSPGTTFPALAALPPVLGTTLLLHLGSTATGGVGALLRWRPVVYVGLISYSLYLWHWPLIVFARYRLGADAPLAWGAALLAVSLVLAGLSYRYIEKPFRLGTHDPRKARAIGLGAAVTVCMVVVSAIGIMAGGFEQRFPISAVAMDRTRIEPVAFEACESRLVADPRGLCTIGDPSRKPDLLLWGDSHLLAWLPAFEAALVRAGSSALVAPNSACPPFLGIDNSADPACRGQNQAVFDLLRGSAEVRTVVMAGFWSNYFSESDIAIASIGKPTGDENAAPAALTHTVAAATTLGKNVVILGPVPTYGQDMALALAQNNAYGRQLLPPLTLEQVRASNAAFYATVQSISSRQVRFVDVATWLCRPECAIQREKASLYRDSNHLSPAGALLFTEDIFELLVSVDHPQALASHESQH